MAQVQLDLALGLEAFRLQVAAAEGLLLRVKSQASAGVSLKAYLDTSSLQEQLKAAQKVLSSGGTTIKVATDFHKTGSQYAISATRLKAQIIDPIQQTIAGNRKYTIKIGTELTFDQGSLRQIEQVIAKAKSSLEATQRSTAAARQQLNQLTQTPGQGGMDPAALRRLQTAAGQAGIKTSATGATEMRKELRTAFAKAGDDAIEGLVRGLVSKNSTVIDASDKTGKALIKALKKSLGIASPSKETRKLGQFSADGFGSGFVQGMVGWERQMAVSIRQAIGNSWKQGLSRDAAARGALADMGRDAGQVISTSLGKALRQGVASSVAPALKGALVGGAGGMVTGGLVGGLGAAGAAVRQAAGPAMTAFGSSAIPQKLGMLGHGASSLAGGGASDAITTFLQNSLDSVVQAALGSGGEGALLGAAGVAGVAGMTGLAKGAGGSLVNQAVESIKNRILNKAATQATKEVDALQQSPGALQSQTPGTGNLLSAAPDKSYKVNLTKPQLGLLEHAVQLDNVDTGTFGEVWKELGGALSTKMELTAQQLNALAYEVKTNPIFDDIEANAEDLGVNAIRIAENIKKKFAGLSRDLEADQLVANQGSLFVGNGKAADVAANISRNMIGQAIQQSQGQARLPDSTGGAVSAPVENAGIVMGVLQNATGSVAKALLAFAKELTPGKLQERILQIAWSIDQAAEQFSVVKKDAQILSGKIQNAWSGISNDYPSQLLPPKPVPGTGLVRQQNLQLGSTVGRTAFDFPQLGYGSEGGRLGPADLDEGRGYLEQSRRGLQAIAGKPGEWKVVEEANGVWQRIKSDAELAQERQRIITQNLTQAANRSNRTWTDRQGIGTFNPFDQAFYRGARKGDPYSKISGPGMGRQTLGGTFGGSSRDVNDPNDPNGPKIPAGTFRRATQQPPDAPGALALRNVPVEFFTSFKDAARLLAEVENRLAAVGRAFDTLNVKSQLQVDQEVRKLDHSLQAVQEAREKREVGDSDVAAATYGAARGMAGLGAKTAEVQNLAQAFEHLGIQSRAAVEAIQAQRNLDLSFIENTLGRDSSEATRARNARDIQQLGRANDLVRTSQGASGFGGFRGREIGNDELNKSQQRSVLANAVREMQEYQRTLVLTEANTKTYQRVQAALTTEIQNAQRAYAVLNGTAKEGETITHLARNAWGTILDDFQNLVPQLLVFAVAYNLILQRVLATPGAVIQAAASFDRLETSISAYLSATRGIGDTSGVIGELRGVALDLGIGFEKAASSYLRFAAATQGTPLEGQEVDITRTIATAGRNQGLSGEQIDRASVALTQILSKGRVQSEELRGQLAEQLPGALQISARAFGVTTKELYRMVEAGQIAGDEFVGRFMRQLKAEGASTNQLAGTFSNVSEQLGSSVQAMGAAAGQPFLAPLTVALQGLNAVIQALIPVAPVLTGLFVVLGASALKAALNHVPLTRELLGAARAMFAVKDPAEGYTAGLVKMTGVARVAASALATLGKAALIGLAFEAAAGTISYLKGEVGALGDELKKLNKIAEGGKGEGLNGIQKILGRLNIAQNFSDSTTFFDAVSIGDSTEKATGKIVGSQKKIAASIKDVNRIEKQLYEERIRRDQAEADKNEEGAKSSIERIKKLEEQRNNVQFDFSPEDAQIQLGALKAAEQATEKLIKRQKALGGNAFIDEQQLGKLRKIREEFEKTAKAAGLLDGNLLKVQSLGALQSRLKANEEILPTLDVNSDTYRNQQLEIVGQRQAVTDQQLLPQERALKTQEMVLRKISTELKAQENIQRIKLSLVDNERKQIEASLSLEQTRGRLREAVAQRRVDVASALNAPEERLAAEAQLQRVRESSQARDLQMQGQLLNKDRERVGIETDLQKEQIRLQTQQLAIDKQMLLIERLKMESAAKTKGISKDLVREYYLQMGQIDKTVAATNVLIGQQGSLLQSVEAGGAAQLSVLGLKQEELNVEQKLLEARGLTQQQVRQIETAQQDIANKQQSALNVLENANAIYDRLQESIQGQLEGVRALVQAEQERARLAEQAAANEMAVVDRLLELQQGRNEGGFFERMAKASVLGASGEQDAFNLAQRRMELQRQIQQQQIRQKQLEMNLKRDEIKAEEALNAIKLRGLRIENEKAKVQARADLEGERLKLVMLGDKASPEQKQLLGKITSLQKNLGGYNPEVPGGGNSQNVSINSAIDRGQQALQRDVDLGVQESRYAVLSEDRAKSLGRANDAQAEELRLQEQLFKLDAAQWFGQFLDKSTQLGRTLGVVTAGLSEFRSTVSQAFGEAIVNGASASEAIADAGKALAGKLVTGLFDEMILKPMEANLFSNLKNLLPDLFKTEQQSLTQSTDLNTSATNSLTTVIGTLTTTIGGLPELFKQLDGRIPKPTTDTPVYRAPENVSLAGSVAGAVSASGAVVGGVANMLPGTKTAPYFNDGLGAGRGHQGQDLGIDPGDPVHARRSGVVSQYIPSFTRPGNRYMGRGLRVKYDDGMEGTYGHMENTNLRPGDKITAGQFLGKIFPDGKNTHLHYELRNRFMELLEPLKWVKESLTVAAGRIQQAATGVPVAPGLPPATPVGPAVMTPLTGAPASTGSPVPVTIVPFGGSPTPLEQAGTAVSSQSPLVGVDTTQALQQLGGNASQAGQSLADVTVQSGQAAVGLGKLNEGTSSATTAMSGVGNSIAGTPAAFSRLNSTISGVVGVLGSIGVGVAGAQQLGKGGISGTLTGLAGIFGAIGSISGMFGTGGMFAGGGGAAKPSAGMSAGGFDVNGMGVAGPNWGIPQRATGGPVVARKPYIVGETGYELFIPESNGQIVSNSRSRAMLDARNAMSGATGQSEASDPFAANRDALSYSTQNKDSDPFAANRDALSHSTGLTKERHTEQVMASSMNASPKPLDIRYQSEIINQTEYVSADQFQRGMVEAAERGRALTFNALKNSVRSRRQVGL